MPGIPIKPLQFVERILAEIEAFPFHVFVPGHPADWCFPSQGTATNAPYDSSENSHVLAKARPYKLSVRILAEPVHMEYSRCFAERTLHFHPVPKVVPHVISAEWQHGHGIAPDFPNGASARRCRF